jgi:PAS domain S-box-containing protein
VQRYIDELRLLHAIRLSVVATGTDGVIMFANEAAEQVYAAGPGELLGRHLLDFLGDDHEPQAGVDALAAVATGSTWRGDLRVRRLDGSTMLAAISATPIHDEHGILVGTVVVSEDMTEQREIEARRDAAERRLRLAHEAARLGTWQWAMSDGDVVWDVRLEEIFGFPPGGYDRTFETWANMIHPDDRPEMMAIVDKALAACSPYVLRCRIIRPDGAVRWIESFGRVTTDELGAATGTIGVVRDVTDEKLTERDLERAYAEQRLASARSELLRQITTDMSTAATTGDVAQVLTARIVDLEALLGGRARLRVPASLVGITDGRVFLRAPVDLPVEDRVMLDDLAAQAGLAAGRAHHQSRTTEIAEHLQSSLAASPLPTVPHVQIAAHYAPGGDDLEHVGGDWYDAIGTGDGAVALVVGDVMGRGVLAATTMIRVRAGIRGLVTVDADPGVVMAGADRLVSRDAGDQFVTAVTVLLDPESRTMRMCNAGHVPVAVAYPDGRLETHGDGSGVPIGLLPGLERHVEEVRLEPGCTVVLVTDGVVESRLHDLDEGIDAFAARVRDLRDAPLDELVAAVAALADATMRDDVTVVAARLG